MIQLAEKQGYAENDNVGIEAAMAQDAINPKPGLGKGRISVVIPCYNHAHFLPDAVESVLAQQLSPAEIIVVDDGSTDHTAQAVAKFGERIRYLYQPNAGLSAARNAGIAVATGEYIGFLDADDLWLPDFLSTLASQLDIHPEWGAVHSGVRFVDAQAKPLSQVIWRTLSADRAHDSLTDSIFFPPCSVLVRRAALDQVGLFDESLRALEDWDMWLRISSKYPFGGIAKILALYRMHGNNMTRDLARMQENYLCVVRKHFGGEQGDPANWPPERQRAFAGVYFWLSLAQSQRHEDEMARAFVQRAFVTNPDLAKSLDTFYMLGCADQPPGYVGDLETLHLDENATNLLVTLKTIFTDPDIPSRLKSNRALSYAMAYFALGILAYRKRQLKQARGHLARAVIYRPGLVRNAQWRSTFAKSLLGSWFLNAGLAWKKSDQPPSPHVATR